jgi:uncharacterized protein
MVIDAHFHVWPDTIASQALGTAPGDLTRFGDGTADGALAAMDAAEIDLAVCLGVADTPQRVPGVNRFAGALTGGRLIGFGSVHARLSAEENLESLRANQLRGVKVHPLFQHYALDDPALLEVLDALQGEFVVVVHVGEGAAGSARCTPGMLRDLVRLFPRLDLVACHFGGYRLLDEVEETIIGLPVHIDTSWPPGLDGLDRGRVRRIVQRHGPDRVIFGSDWPLSDPAADVAAVRALGLPDDETAAILGGNMARLLGLE